LVRMGLPPRFGEMTSMYHPALGYFMAGLPERHGGSLMIVCFMVRHATCFKA